MEIDTEQKTNLSDYKTWNNSFLLFRKSLFCIRKGLTSILYNSLTRKDSRAWTVWSFLQNSIFLSFLCIKAIRIWYVWLRNSHRNMHSVQTSRLLPDTIIFKAVNISFQACQMVLQLAVFPLSLIPVKRFALRLDYLPDILPDRFFVVLKYNWENISQKLFAKFCRNHFLLDQETQQYYEAKACQLDKWFQHGILSFSWCWCVLDCDTSVWLLCSFQKENGFPPFLEVRTGSRRAG